MKKCGVEMEKVKRACGGRNVRRNGGVMKELLKRGGMRCDEGQETGFIKKQMRF